MTGRVNSGGRIILATLLIMGLASGAPTLAATTTARGVPAPTTVSRLAAPNAPAGLTMPLRPDRGASMPLLRFLLSSPQGRKLLRGGIDAVTLARLERTYGGTTAGATRLAAPPPAPSRIARTLAAPVRSRTQRAPVTPARPRVHAPARLRVHAPARALVAVPARTREASPARPSAAQAARVRSAYAALPLSFELNRGQSGRDVRFLAHGAGADLLLTATDAVLVLSAPVSRTRGHMPARHALPAPRAAQGSPVVRLRLVGANPAPRITALDALPGRVNYLIGHDPRGWITGVPTYARVAYRDIYPGIDLVYHGRQGHLEYDYTVAPGADPRAIRLAVEGAGTLALDRAGNLVLRSAAGVVEQDRPVAYQEIAGARRAVAVRFVLRGRVAGLALGAYDAHYPLIVDPTYNDYYSTYLNPNNDYINGKAIAMDGAGNFYVAGQANRPPPSNGSNYSAAFVSKISADGQTLLYTTYLGGAHSLDANGNAANSSASGVAVDDQGHAYVVGTTNTSDFPTTTNALATTASGGLHAVVSVLSTAGALTPGGYSTYLTSGNGSDYGNASAVAPSSGGYENVAITGKTSSSDFPTSSNALDANHSVNGAFATELSVCAVCTGNNLPTTLQYSTLLGGLNEGNGVAVDASGKIYVAGNTNPGSLFGQTSNNPFNASYSYRRSSITGPNKTVDGFVVVVDPNATQLLYGTYLGGSVKDLATGIALVPNASMAPVWVTGYTASPDFPHTSGAYQQSLRNQATNGTNAFVVKLITQPPAGTPDDSTLVYGTYLGGSGSASGGDTGNSVATDAAGDAFVGGNTNSTDFPTLNAFQQTNRTNPTYTTGFVAAFSSAGALLFSSYLGGARVDEVQGVAADGTGRRFYVTGFTGSFDFPTTTNRLSGPPPTNSSYAVAFVTYLAPPPPPRVTSLSPPDGPTGGGTTVTITGTTFVPGQTTVTFGNTTVPTSGVSVSGDGTVLTVSSPPATLSGTVDVTVTTPNGSSSTTPADRFTYRAAPTIGGISPSDGPTGGGTSVTITGTNFVSGETTVSFGGTTVSAANVRVIASNTLTVISPPAGAAGPVDVTVTTPGGSATRAGGFTYRAAPTVSDLSPTAGPTGGGTTVTITGTGFVPGGTTVTFGGNSVPASGVTVNSTGAVLTVSTPPVPANQAGPVSVTVATSGGQASAPRQFTYLGAPGGGSITPAGGPIGGGTPVTITGTGFSPGQTRVFFNGREAGPVAVTGSMTITTISPPSTITGTVPVTVQTPGGTVTNGYAFTYAAAPAISRVSPNRGRAGDAVEIDGSGFTGASQVTFGDQTAVILGVNGDTQLFVTAPARAAGTVDVAISAYGGASPTTAADRFTYLAAAPTVTGLRPTAGPSAGGTTVVISGTGFTGANNVSPVTVTFGQQGADPSSITVDPSGNLITATSPATSGAGMVDVTVTTDSGTSAPSAADLYTYALTPTVGSVSPAAGPLGGGTRVTISGRDFAGARGVLFGSQAATAYTVDPSGAVITATSPATTTPGAVDVRVTTTGGTSPATRTDLFTYANGPAVTSLTPTSGPLGSITVVISGTDLGGASAVTFGSQNAPHFSVSSDGTVITATSPATSTPGVVDVRVTTPGGTTAPSPADRFTYRDLPRVDTFAPTAGPIGGGTTVVITGANFVPGATTVSFGGRTADPSTVSVAPDGTVITATSPAATTDGPVDITVTTSGGTSRVAPNAPTFTYYRAPTVSAISPAGGPIGGGTDVLITGTNFMNVTGIAFGSQVITSAQFTVHSPTFIDATSPATSTPGVVDVRVTTPGGTSPAVAADRFGYARRPTVTGLSPTSGPLSGGTMVVISGTDLAGAARVTFGSQAADPSSIVVDPSGAVITVTSPATTTPGAVDVQVTTVGGTSRATDADLYTYRAPTPTVTNTSTTGPTATGTPPTPTATGTTAPSATSTVTTVPSATPTATPRPTETDTPTPTSRPTATPTDTSTPRPTATATDTPTNTPTDTPTTAASSTASATATNTAAAPTATPTACGGGFHAVVGGWSFDATGCASGNTITGVVVTPPSGLTLAGAITPVTLALDPSGQPQLPIALPDFAFSRFGATFNVQGASLDASGLTAASTTFNLPKAYGGFTLTASGLRIGTDGSINGSVALAPAVLRLSFRGFGVLATAPTLSQAGVSVADFNLILPDGLVPAGASSLLVAHNITLGFDGTLLGSIRFSPIPVSVGGFTLTASDVSFGDHVLSFNNVGLQLPANLFPSGSGGLVLSGSLSVSTSKQITATLSASNPTLNVAGFTLTAPSVTLTNAGLSVDGASLSFPADQLPSGLTLPPLQGSLQISPAFAVVGRLSVTGASLSLDGFAATGDLTLDNSGLTANATVSLSRVPGMSAIALAGSLQITPDYKLIGRLSLNGATFSEAGFSGTGNFTLDNSGLAVNASFSVTPPGTNAFTLSGTLQVTKEYTVTGSLSAGPFNLTLAGFMAGVRTVTLDNGGLTVSGASLTLPGLGDNLSSIGLTGQIHVDRDFHVVGAVSAAPFTLQASGLGVHVDGVTLSNDGLDVTNATAILPAPFDNVNVGGSLHIGSDLSVTGTLAARNPSFSYAGLTIGADSVSMNLQRTPAPAGADGSATVSIGLHIVNASVALQGVPGLDNVVVNGDLSAAFDGSGKPQISGQLVLGGRNGSLIHLAVAGFTLDVASVTLDNSGVSVDGVSLTLPRELSPSGTGLKLVGAFKAQRANGAWTLSGYIGLQHIELSAYGFTLSVDNIQLGTSGLVIGNATLDLSQAFPDGGFKVRTVSVSGLTLSPSFKVSGGVIRINGRSRLELTLGGATLSIDRVSFVNLGLKASSAALTLPSPFDNTTLTVADLTLAAGKTVSLDLGATDFAIAGFALHAASVHMDNKTGILAKGLTFTLPILPGPVSLGDIGYDLAKHSLIFHDLPLPTSFSLPSFTPTTTPSVGQQVDACKAIGGTYLALPQLSAGGFGINGAGACLSFPKGGGWILAGEGTVDLKAFTIACTFEVGSVSQDYPFVFHNATIDVQLAQGIPLGPTGLELNSFKGALGFSSGTNLITGQPGVIVSAGVGAGIQTDDGGNIFTGKGFLTVATDGNAGLSVDGVLVRFINLHAAACARIVASPDFVCKNALADDPTFAAQATGTGIYVIVGASVGFHAAEDITAYINARAHLWVDANGPEIAASGDIGAKIPANAFFPLIPPCAADVNAHGELGTFLNGSNRVLGVKARFTANICPEYLSKLGLHFSLDESAFVDQNGNLHTTDANNYALVQGRNGGGYLLAHLGNGLTRLSRVAPVFALPAASPFALPRGLAAPARDGAMRASAPLVSGAANAGRAARPGAGNRQAPAVVPYSNAPVVTVVPGQDDTYFNLLWRQGAPTFSVTAPDGTVYTPGHVAAPNASLHLAHAGVLPPGFAAADVIFIRKPLPGAWKVTVGNLTGHEGYDLEVHGGTPAPTLSVATPATGQTLVAQPTARLSGTLAGADPSSAPTVSLYYATSPTLRIGGHARRNDAGQLIAHGVPVVGGAWGYTWDTSTVPAGTYYIYAVLDNGMGPDVRAFAAGAVRVVQPARPDAPRGVVATDHGFALAVLWTPPARAGIVTGYRLRWRTNATPRGRYYALDAGRSTSYTLVEALRGARYRVEVAAYDVQGRLSAWVPARLGEHAGAHAPAFRFAAGRAQIVAGGMAAIPLTLRPVVGARATGGPSDFVTLSVDRATLPAGLLAAPTLTAVNLFAPATGSAAPALPVSASRLLRPGVYALRVVARQTQGGRVVRVGSVHALLVIQGGAPSQISLLAGRPHALGGGLVGVPITARVGDGSGAPVGDGYALTFGGVLGAFTPGRVEIVGGVARTTLTYVAGTPPIVTADAGSTLGRLYIGRAPGGTSNRHFFAAAAGQPGARQTSARPATPATSEDLVLRNVLPGVATARLRLFVQHGATVQVQEVNATLSPRQTVAEHLDALTQGYPLVGVEVESDLPIVATRVVRARLAGGRTVVVGMTRGVVPPRAAYALRLNSGRTTLDLFNPSARPVRVGIAVVAPVTGRGMRERGTGMGTGTVLTLAPNASARVEIGNLLAALGETTLARRHQRLGAGPARVTVRAAAPVVVEVDPLPNPLAQPKGLGHGSSTGR